MPGYTSFSGCERDVVASLGIFARGLSARPQVYGVSAQDAAEAVRLVEDLERCMKVLSDPARATSPNRLAKNMAKAAAIAHCRPLATFIRVNPNLSDADRAALGVPPKTEKRRIPPPATKPLLELAGIVPGGHVLNFYDAPTPNRRRRPEGVAALEVFVAYSPMGSEMIIEDILKKTHPDRPHARLTRSGGHVLHANEKIGSLANYIGRWVNGRGEAGPWSQPVRMLLALPLQERAAA